MKRHVLKYTHLIYLVSLLLTAGCTVNSDLKDIFSTDVSKKLSDSPDLNSFVYAYTTSGVNIFKINPVTGAAESRTDLLSSEICGWLVTDSSYNYGFAACSDGKIHSYRIDQTTGVPQEIATLTTALSQYGLVLDPSHKYLYSLSWAGEVAYLTINQSTGELTEHAAIAADASCNYPVNIAISGNSKFAYVVCYNSGTISYYTLNQTNGAPTLSGHFTPATWDGPSWVGTDLSGQYAFYTSQNFDTVSSLSINQSTGQLTLINTAAMGAGQGPNWGSVHPSGSLLFTTNSTNDLSSFHIAANGTITKAGDLTTSWGINSQPAMLPNSVFAYIGNGATVSALVLDLTTGIVSFSSALTADSGGGAGGCSASKH